MGEQQKVNHMTLSEAEVERYMSIKKRLGRLSLGDELKIIHSYDLDVGKKLEGTGRKIMQ